MAQQEGKRDFDKARPKLEALPHIFNRQKYFEVATAQEIEDKTAGRYITQFVAAGFIHRDSKDNYMNNQKRMLRKVRVAGLGKLNAILYRACLVFYQQDFQPLRNFGLRIKKA